MPDGSRVTICPKRDRLNERCRLPGAHECDCVFVGEPMPPALAEAFYEERRLVRALARRHVINKLARKLEGLVLDGEEL